MNKEFVCIVCPNGCRLSASSDNGKITVTGNTCERGEKFAVSEMTAPMRSLTSTVRTIYPEAPVIPVRTNGEIPKEKIRQAMSVIAGVTAEKRYKTGETVIKDLLGTGVNVIATSSLLKNVQ